MGKLPLILVFCAWVYSSISQASPTYPLDKGWLIQSSEKVGRDGVQLTSRPQDSSLWIPTHVPTTVVAALVENQILPDPNFGSNFQKLPGLNFIRDDRGDNFSLYDMPSGSPFLNSWWYLKTFSLNQVKSSERLVLHFDGINYRANIFFNGHQIAIQNDVVGSFRSYAFDVTKWVTKSENRLAVEVMGPTLFKSLATTWVDWAPSPPDKNMGIFRDVYLTRSGDVVLSHPQVISKVPSSDKALLTLEAEVENLGERNINGFVNFHFDGVNLKQPVNLQKGERKIVDLPFEQLNPKLWWPRGMGQPLLHHASVDFIEANKTSDHAEFDFGIREITSELTQTGARLFKVNGVPVFIRGGGWANDLLLRPDPKREDIEIQYVKNLNLNTLRFEGQIPSPHLLDLVDRNGILVMAGLACCNYWESWDQWNPGDLDIALKSVRDQAQYLKSHASALVYLYGSDGHPPPEIESRYLDLFKEVHWSNPSLASASQDTTLVGPTGVKMSGPYEYVPPMYWYTDKKKGGAFGFNTETGPGMSVPNLETLTKFLPQEKLWPINDTWLTHTGGNIFHTLDRFNKAVSLRYGEPQNLAEYLIKAQVLSYENERAMFEAYSKNKFTESTGIIQWMLNSPWPSLIWHLYDHDLSQGGSYFGAKKANESLHIQYSYDDQSVVVVNQGPKATGNLKATVEVFDFDLHNLYKSEKVMSVTPDSATKVDVIPNPPKVSTTYFVKVTLADKRGHSIDHNFYWLSTKKEKLDYSKSEIWAYTPVTDEADLTLLNSLKPAKVEGRILRAGSHFKVQVKNVSENLAFSVYVKIVRRKDGSEVLPSLWSDNYISLMPGESRKLLYTGALPSEDVIGVINGWNVKPSTIK